MSVDLAVIAGYYLEDNGQFILIRFVDSALTVAQSTNSGSFAACMHFLAMN